MRKTITESKGVYKDINRIEHNWSVKIELEDVNGKKRYTYKSKDNNSSAITINFYDDYLEMICLLNTYKIYYKNIIAVACVLGNKQIYIKEKMWIKCKFYFRYGDYIINYIIKKILSQYPTFNIKKIKINNIKQYIYLIIVVTFAIILVYFLVKPNNNNNSDWSELTDEEKEWYENNYDDGKIDDIYSAINGYNNK